MEQIKRIKYWGLWIIRGLIYLFIGASFFWAAQPAYRPTVLLVGGLLLVAGVCGCIYGWAILRIDRNYFWELLRSLFDIGFGVAVLTSKQGNLDGLLDILAFWATTYAFIHAVQSIYIFMLSGVKQPRNIFGNLLHLVSVILAGALAYVLLMVPDGVEVSLLLIGALILVIGLIMLVLAINQRQTILTNRSI